MKWRMKLAYIVTLNLWIRPIILSNILDCVSMTNDLRMAFLSFWRPHRASAVSQKTVNRSLIMGDSPENILQIAQESAMRMAQFEESV